MTLGGMLKHLAFVEHWWFHCVFQGHESAEPWASVDWHADGDWDWHSAADDTPERAVGALDAAVAAADRISAGAGLGRPRGAPEPRSGEAFRLRWILLHMVEEYARHNGHADLIRESIDGAGRRLVGPGEAGERLGEDRPERHLGLELAQDADRRPARCGGSAGTTGAG